jgi:dipicolinate synthase subunit A
MTKEEKACTVSVVGGDLRSLYAARVLAKEGYGCRLFHLADMENPCAIGFERGRCQAPYLLEEAFSGAGCLLLPLPLTRDGKTLNAPFSPCPPLLSHLEEQIPQGLPLVGGGLSRPFFKERRGVTVDLLSEEDFALQNALPSAEGALGLALLHHKGVLFGSNCAIFGYGRIAEALLCRLLALGAEVTVFARRQESLFKAEAAGARALPFLALGDHLPAFDLLFNTVPAPVLSPELCALLGEEALYLELASPPFGVCESGRQVLGKRLLMAGGLPGKYAPLYGGALIARRVLALFKGESRPK